MLTIQKLFEITEESFGTPLSIVSELLSNALNDWRIEVNSVDEYIEHLKAFLKTDEITKDILEVKVVQLNPEYYSWEMESISNVIEAFKVSETTEINSLIKFVLRKEDNCK